MFRSFCFFTSWLTSVPVGTVTYTSVSYTHLLSVAVFYVARLAPGDPLISYYGDRTEKMSPEEREWAMEKLGLNEPISVQYVKWVKNAFHGEFGISFKYKQDVVCLLYTSKRNAEDYT